jgi:hypothetical protein
VRKGMGEGEVAGEEERVGVDNSERVRKRTRRM